MAHSMSHDIPCPPMERMELEVLASAPVGHYPLDGYQLEDHSGTIDTCPLCGQYEPPEQGHDILAAFREAARAVADQHRMDRHTHWEVTIHGRHAACMITAEHRPHKLLRFPGEECGGDRTTEPVSVRWRR